jgi:hypothetical protein
MSKLDTWLAWGAVISLAVLVGIILGSALGKILIWVFS